ncbi:MAG: bifunctional phosphopantothenoylcysteine decarboxylase/phosphopantothenate--cysteine ligase CoaBC [Acidobacteriota bacterium]
MSKKRPNSRLEGNVVNIRRSPADPVGRAPARKRRLRGSAAAASARTVAKGGKNSVVLGVCGGIAAYKAPDIVRRLQEAGLDVVVAVTANAQRFVTPLTLQALSRHRVISNPWDLEGGTDIEHVALARRAAAFVVAPATANMIGKMANGIADDFLSTFYLATQAPVLIAPGMNDKMLGHPAVRRNLDCLMEAGIEIIDPGEGYLACGDWGPGRMAEPAQIAEAVGRRVEKSESWRSQHVLVTAGPTQEPIDHVRFISNRSSGRMGYALAAAARRRGANVTLISGPTSLAPPRGVYRINVRTAEEMRRAVLEAFDPATVVIQSAAVSDYMPRQVQTGKPAKQRGGMRLDLDATPDILAELGRRKGKRLLIGFAAETHDLKRKAQEKLRRKKTDLLVANNVSREEIGFESERNAVLVLDSRGREVKLAEAPKTRIAEQILDIAEEYLPS